MAKCAATTEKGVPCNFSAAYGELCVSHAAKNGDEAALAEQRARASVGGTATGAAHAAEKRTSCRLRTTDDLLSELERALVAVECSAADTSSKAGLVVKLVAEARATLKAAELETENKALRSLLLERHPELRAQLKAVR